MKNMLLLSTSLINKLNFFRVFVDHFLSFPYFITRCFNKNGRLQLIVHSKSFLSL